MTCPLQRLKPVWGKPILSGSPPRLSASLATALLASAALVFPTSLAAGSSSAPQDPDEVDNPFAGFETHFLSNGLKVWYQRTPDEPDVYLSAIIPYGRDSDFRGKEQVAHFLEHMLFSDHMGRTEEEIRREIEDRGGSRNGITSSDRTYYFATIEKEHGFFALDWLYRIVSPHEMDPDVVETQRQPVALEIGARPREFFDWIMAYVIDPPWLRMEGFWEREFGLETRLYRWYDPYTSLYSIGPEDLREFYDTYYVPSRMTLVVVGDMERDSVLAQAEATFGTLPVRPEPGRQYEISDPGRYRQSIIWDFRANVLYDTRFKIYDLTPEKHLRLIVIQEILRERLRQRLRFGERKAVYGVSVFLTLRGPATYVRIYAQIDEEEFEYAEGVIEEELDFLRNATLPADEFERVRQTVVAQLVREARDPEVLGRMASSRFYNPDLHRDYPDLVGFFQSVSQEELAGVARGLFVPERRVHSVVRRQPLSQGMFVLLVIAVVALAIHLARRLMTRRIEMPRIRYVARFKRHLLARVVGASVMAVVIAVVYRIAFQGIYLFYGSVVAPVDSYIVQYAFISLCVVAGILGIVACLASLPHKLLVFDDHILVKYRAYRSRHITFSDVKAISTLRLGGFLKRGGPLRFAPLTLALVRPGILLETGSGRGFFFRVRDVDELIATVNGLRGATQNPTEAPPAQGEGSAAQEGLQP